MDLNTIEAVVRPKSRADLAPLTAGDAWLAGGTWLFSEPQPRLRRLVDLDGLGWTPLTVTPDGLSIAATCTIAALDAFEPPPAWTAGPLLGLCCAAFLASFKVWHTATVGGNICMALPAGPMISLCAALDGMCRIWTPEGGERSLPVLDFVTGPQQTGLEPGELLRQIDIPQTALLRRFAFRRLSLSPLGRSGVLLIGTMDGSGASTLTITAATRRPVRLAFDGPVDPTDVRAALASAIPDALYYDDVHGAPAWRRHMTFAFAEEIRAELTA